MMKTFGSGSIPLIPPARIGSAVRALLDFGQEIGRGSIIVSTVLKMCYLVAK
jgi:hypothetical protein